MIERVKVLLSLNDEQQDPILNEIIENIKSHLKVELGKDSIPTELNFIVVELAVKRFNRIGSEGMKSESVEGHNTSYYDLGDEFKSYAGIIAKFAKKEDYQSKRGKVMFL